MAWIEQRRAQYRVYERPAEGGKAHEPFATREDAGCSSPSSLTPDGAAPWRPSALPLRRPRRRA